MEEITIHTKSLGNLLLQNQIVVVQKHMLK